MATLGDLDLQPFTTALTEAGPAGEVPVTAPDGEWLVLVGDVGPVTAIPPGATLADGVRPPGILVAEAGLNLAEAFDSDAFRLLTSVSALVLTEPTSDEAGGYVVAGVVDGRTLTNAALRAATRSGLESVLPGTPATIPWIVRSCGFTAGGRLCATSMTFLTRPYPPPACRNDRGLAVHDFAW